MIRPRRRALRLLAATLATPWLRIATAATDATDFPAKPIRLITTAPVGSGIDIGARLLAESLRVSFNQSVVVENRPGADGIIATRLVAQAPPDGCTLLAASNGQMSVTPLLHDPPPYEFERDFEPVAMLARWPLVLVVTPSLPVHTLGELIAYAKARPDELNYGSASGNYVLATEMVLKLAGIRVRQIPYGGVAAVSGALVAGDVHLAVINAVSAIPLLKAGKLRALAVNTPTRQASLPDVPTFAEAGMPRYDFVIWSGIFAPAGTPAPVIARLHEAAVTAMRAPEVAARFAGAGMSPTVGGPREMRDIITRERASYGELARSLRATDGAAK